ncbi:hypothetical protein GO986_15380 [Deinococcus sp. HMF7620]|uniref:YCII-related domain-containing protein n=1 Tax=Deinococcus arboris TaxID=2682977 RepID=A0A7C9HSW1_9DEIO|nr:YciI family protein [Deinococcus arboris]MVN88134.1 hypothetical protein [Deinococcus arboris]
MFVVLLQYIQPLSAVEPLLEAHRAFLEQHYATGHFVASGAQVPRTGGVILVRGLSREALDSVLAEDPFAQADLAAYEVIEFRPARVAAGAEAFFASEADH